MCRGGSALVPPARPSNPDPTLQVRHSRARFPDGRVRLTHGADYPSNTVPNKVAQLFSAQLFHDRKQRWTRSQALAKGGDAGEAIDYLRPMIADADTGHGGASNLREWLKLIPSRIDSRDEAHQDDG